jgi:uncharacterized protein YhbP (UPF0306 family)
MLDMKELIKTHLDQVNIMQLATVADSAPWACNLHFYAGDDMSLYWISSPKSRHSQELAANPNVAVAVMVHENSPEENYVIGLSMVGRAELLQELPPDPIVDGYMAKHKRHPKLAVDIRSGENPNKFYKFTPSKVILIDSKNFPDQSRQELPL